MMSINRLIAMHVQHESHDYYVAIWIALVSYVSGSYIAGM